MQISLDRLTNSKTYSILIIWGMFWFLIAGGSIYALPEFGADQLNKFYITSTYFFSFALLGGFYYKINETLPHKAPLKNQLFFISLISLLLVGIGLSIDKIFQINYAVYEKIYSSKFYFPLFKIETLITKICDVSFQQVFIFGLLKKLKGQGQTNGRILTLFGIGFFVIHLPLFFSLKIYAFYFIIPSIFAGLIFSYLILNYRYGQSLSFAVHLLFYLLIGVYLRY